MEGETDYKRGFASLWTLPFLFLLILLLLGLFHILSALSAHFIALLL